MGSNELGPISSLTFDDNWKSQRTVAYQLMKEHGMVGTFYIVVGRIGAEGKMTSEKLMARNMKYRTS